MTPRIPSCIRPPLPTLLYYDMGNYMYFHTTDCITWLKAGLRLIVNNVAVGDHELIRSYKSQ